MTPPFIPSWTTTPIPHFTLSASGLIVLADLSTIAQRTALRGGSSWLDALLLVPGLHYQQAADELSRGEGAPVLTAVEIDSSSSESANNDKPIAHRIVNQAVVNYVLRTAQEGRTVVLDVGEVPVRSRSWALGGMGRGQRAMLYAGGRSKGGRSESEELSWLAQLLYLASPVLTGVAIAFIVLLKDCEFCFLVPPPLPHSGSSPSGTGLRQPHTVLSQMRSSNQKKQKKPADIPVKGGHSVSFSPS